jgi:hypothetical protein
MSKRLKKKKKRKELKYFLRTFAYNLCGAVWYKQNKAKNSNNFTFQRQMSPGTKDIQNNGTSV